MVLIIMAKPTFTRKLVNNRGSLQINIPAHIVKNLKLEAGDLLIFTLKKECFQCTKAKNLTD